MTRFTFDLGHCIFHQDLNLPGRLAGLLKERRYYLNHSRSEVDKARGWQFS